VFLFLRNKIIHEMSGFVHDSYPPHQLFFKDPEKWPAKQNRDYIFPSD